MNRVIFNPSLFNRYYDDTFQKVLEGFKNNKETSKEYFPVVNIVEKDNSITLIDFGQLFCCNKVISSK